MRRKTKYTIFFFLLLPLLGIVSIIVSTRWGVHLCPDSSTFIGFARNLINGVNLSVMRDWTQISRVAPLFSSLLAGIGILGIDPLIGARWLNAFLFGVSIFLVGFIINKYTHSFWLSILGSFFILTSEDALLLYSKAMSDPLFIFSALLGIYLLANYLQNQKMPFLIASAGSAGLAFLARYAGIVLVITALMGVLILNAEKWKKRLRDSVIFLTISCIPIALWIIRNIYARDTFVGRQIAFHPFTVDELSKVATFVSRWLLPVRVPMLISHAILAAGTVSTSLLVLTFILIEKKEEYVQRYFSQGNLSNLPALLVLFILIHGVSLIVAYSFFEDSGGFREPRLLFPIFIFGLVLIFCLFKNLFFFLKQKRSLYFLGIILCLILFGFYIKLYLNRGIVWIRDRYKSGYEWSAPLWKGSEIVKQIGLLDSRRPVFTNHFHLLYLFTGKNIRYIPKKSHDAAKMYYREKIPIAKVFYYEDNENYLAELDVMRKRLKNENGLLVYFNPIYINESDSMCYPSEEEINKKLPLRLIKKGAEGAIYALSE